MGLCRDSTKFLHIKSFIVIAIIFIVHYLIIQFDFEGRELFVNVTLMASISITIYVLIVMIKNYRGAKGMVTAFAFLLISYIFYLFGEVSWFTYESILDLYPYPSIADVGFFFYFVFTGIFLVSIIRCFKTIQWHDIGIITIIVSVIMGFYLTLSLDAQADPEDILFGFIFLISSATVFGISFIALVKFRLMLFGVTWFIIFASMLITTVADIFYYTVENTGVYTYDHVINTMWIVSDAVLVYALLIHRRDV